MKWRLGQPIAHPGAQEGNRHEMVAGFENSKPTPSGLFSPARSQLQRIPKQYQQIQAGTKYSEFWRPGRTVLFKQLQL